jgi:ribosomal protein L39E
MKIKIVLKKPADQDRQIPLVIVLKTSQTTEETITEPDPEECGTNN